jgi:cyclic pyranopterin phosphate synthase
VSDASTTLLDSRGRPLHDLRISVTDRCNFRCNYCMPKASFGPGFQFLPRPELLSFEELTRLAGIFVGLGVRKLRITGGEPLLRSELPSLIRMLAPLGAEIALTTNGSLLAQHAAPLFEAGLRRVTVSLDSLDDATFRALNDVDFPVSKVLAGIDAASGVGLRVKVNAVIRRGFNQDSVVELARHFKGSGHVVRFIEFMDVGITNGWRLDQVVSASEMIAAIDAEFPLEPIAENYSGEVARRYRYQDGTGEVGVIASVTEPFCSSCTRARLSANGQLHLCLFSSHGTDLRATLRDGSSDAQVTELLRALWAQRSDRYSALRTENTRSLPKIEMSYIGG